MKERENFGSRLGFILVSAGCAIGLGNVWKFPYICGQYGGAAFILIYMVFLAILGLPIIICEFAIGRGSKTSIAKSFDILEPRGQKWHHFKWIGIVGCYLLMMFYTMVGGWMMYYAYNMASGKLTGLKTVEVISIFSNMLMSPGTMIFWMVIVTLFAFGCVALGLQNGVEKITKIMMSLLLIMMIVLAMNSIRLNNASAGLRFYLIPNLDSIRQNGLGTVVFAAMTHAFFTLSVGIGAMSIFGSYLSKERKLTGEAISIVLVDTFVALVAGLIIIPACFAYNVKPDAGPSLLFITLPNVFNHMAAGRIWGTLFFIFMTFAAMSTIIAVFEAIIAANMELTGWSRTKSVKINIAALIVLALPAILGFNILSGFSPLGDGTSVMDLEDFLVSYNLLPLGSLVFVMFCTEKSGWGFDSFLKECNTGEGMNFPKVVRTYMTYFLPMIIVIVYLKGYYDMFAGMGTKVLAFWMCIAFLFLGFIFWFSRNHIKK
ncbi:MAG: sodium-dependent transporter [Lachnospiraceae bacterium]|nr:sodium-dependent transporter [Lachnospiraceae bacterium]